MNNAVKAIDATATDYDNFVSGTKEGGEADPEYKWMTAYSYDKKLQVFYQGKYNLKTTNQLRSLRKNPPEFDSQATEGDFVLNHYGDWPAPETWVFNTPG